MIERRPPGPLPEGELRQSAARSGQLGKPPPRGLEQTPQGEGSRSPEFDLPAQGEGSAPAHEGHESTRIQPMSQKEGRIDELIQFLGGHDAIREAYVREQARRYLAENYYNSMIKFFLIAI